MTFDPTCHEVQNQWESGPGRRCGAQTVGAGDALGSPQQVAGLGGAQRPRGEAAHRTSLGECRFDNDLALADWRRQSDRGRLRRLRMGHRWAGQSGQGDHHRNRQPCTSAAHLTRPRRWGRALPTLAQGQTPKSMRAELQQARRGLGGIQAVRGIAVEFGGDPVEREGVPGVRGRGCRHGCPFIAPPPAWPRRSRRTEPAAAGRGHAESRRRGSAAGAAAPRRRRPG